METNTSNQYKNYADTIKAALELLSMSSPAYSVSCCEDFEELKEVFDAICPIKGSRKEYDSESLKNKIEQLRIFVNTLPFDNVPWNLITRTHGIRAKCMELFYYEKRGI